MQLLCQLLIRMRLNTQRLADGQHLEQEWQLSAISLRNFTAEQRLVILNEVEQRTLRHDIFGEERGVCAHP